jgi:hypothetical protein
MTARSNYNAIGSTTNTRGNYSPEADRRNFEIGNSETGAADMIEGFRQKGATGFSNAPTIDTTQSGAMGQIEQQGRSQQEILAEALRAQAMGTGYSPGIAQLQQSTQAAQANQRSVAAGSMGYEGAAARREAAFGGAALSQQAVGQGRAIRANDMAFGRDGYAQFAEGMRGQDLGLRGAYQTEAVRGAQLADDQRARDDAMAKFYLAEEARVRQAQSQANQNYEAQDANNKLGVADIEAGRRAFNEQMNNRNTAAGLGAAGSLLAAGATYPSTTPGVSRKRNPEDPFDPGY